MKRPKIKTHRLSQTLRRRINAAIRQIGRKIVVDVELALSPCRAEEGGSQMVTMKGNPYRYLQDFYY